jgi:drug/metabolite transporter (DMT)-like permease
MLIKQETSLSRHRLRLRVRAAVGPLLMLASGFIFAVMDCLIKVSVSSFRLWDIAFYRFGGGMVILLLIFSWRRNPFDGHNRKYLLLRGIAGSISFFAVVIAYRLIPISTALVLFYVFPAFAALFSSLFFKEKITKDLLWAVVTLVGVAVMLDSRLEGALLGQIMSLVGAAFSGIGVAAVKKARETNGPVIISLYFCLAGAAMSFVPFVADPQLPTSAHDWFIVGGIVTSSLIAQLLMNQGFHYCGSFDGGLLLTSEVLFVALWGIIFLHEPVTWNFLVGGSLILVSIIALNRSVFMAESRPDGKCS